MNWIYHFTYCIIYLLIAKPIANFDINLLHTAAYKIVLPEIPYHISLGSVLWAWDKLLQKDMSSHKSCLCIGIAWSKNLDNSCLGLLVGWKIFRTILHEDFKNQCRTHLVDAQLLPTQPTYQLGHRLHGQSCVSWGFVWSKNQEGSYC